MDERPLRDGDAHAGKRGFDHDARFFERALLVRRKATDTGAFQPVRPVVAAHAVVQQRGAAQNVDPRPAVAEQLRAANRYEFVG